MRSMLLCLAFFQFLLHSCAEQNTEKDSNKSASVKKDSLNEETVYQEEWGVYLTYVDDLPASIVVDLGLKEIAPMAEKPNCIWITIVMKNPYENGLSSSAERPVLDKIDQAIHQSLTTKLNAVNAGRMNMDGRLHLYFYAGDTLRYDALMKANLSLFPEYEFKYGAYFDNDWKAYFDFLYPDAREYQIMMNQNLVSALIDNGDQVEIPRPVNHWIYFRTAEDREKFILRAEKQGFVAEIEEYVKTELEYPYQLMVKRNDKVDLESVNEYVLLLFELALECNGEYDGWETIPQL